MNNPFKFEKPKQSLDALLGLPKDKIVREISIGELKEIIEQPFNAYSSEALEALQEDIKENGLLSPLVVAPIDDGYEILAGRNRYRACKNLGMEAVPCIVRNNLNEAKRNLILVASNLMQRQKLLPSERAKAYKMHKDACEALNIKFRPELLESAANVYKYLRLNNLDKTLMDKVDHEEITFILGYEISSLSQNAQLAVNEYLSNGNSVTTDGINALKDYDKNGVEITDKLIELCETTLKSNAAVPGNETLSEAFKERLERDDASANTLIDNTQKTPLKPLKDDNNSISIINEPIAAESVSISVASDLENHENGSESDSTAINVIQTERASFDAISGHSEDENACDDRLIVNSQKTTEKSLECLQCDPALSIASSMGESNDIEHKDDTLYIARNELPWTLRRNCEMDKLKKMLLNELVRLSDTYFMKYHNSKK